jgi:hypothetical protein
MICTSILDPSSLSGLERRKRKPQVSTKSAPASPVFAEFAAGDFQVRQAANASPLHISRPKTVLPFMRTLQRATTSRASVCIGLLWAATLTPSTSFGQINDLDGVWQGTLACSEQLEPSGRAGSPPFTALFPVTVSMGAMTAQRETARIIETHNGTIQRSGQVTLDAMGRRKDASGKPWRIRLKGLQTGTSMALNGPLESVDGKEKWRTCKLTLTLTTPPTRPVVVDAPRAPPNRPATPAAMPSAVPAAARAQTHSLPKASIPSPLPNEDRQAAARQQAEAAANAKAMELEAARTAATQAAADRAAAEKLATDKAAAEKAAADKRTEDGKKAPIRVRSTMDL